MATTILVSSVQNALNDVILNNFKSTPEVTVGQGSVSGDGYASKTYSINVKGEGKDFNIFVKYMPESGMSPELVDQMKNLYHTELKFYGEIYPAMLKFQKDQKVEDPFVNVPKHYEAKVSDLEVPPVLLENIKILGYTLRNRKQPIDDKHITLALKTFAKYHAVSYALKDQNRELFDKMGNGLVDHFMSICKLFGMDTLMVQSVEALKAAIDPNEDKQIFDVLPTLGETLASFVTTTDKYVDEYAVLCQGDCWSNNMMFLYDEKTGDPIDVKLLDWQLLRLNSPVLDVAYFFYTVATKPILDDFDRYIKYYHDELSAHIKRLGSDPEVLYPFGVFMQHWKMYSKFGLAMSFMVVKLLLFEDDEVPNFMESVDTSMVKMFGGDIQHQDTYNEIIIDLLRHFVKRGFI